MTTRPNLLSRRIGLSAEQYIVGNLHRKETGRALVAAWSREAGFEPTPDDLILLAGLVAFGLTLGYSMRDVGTVVAAPGGGVGIQQGYTGPETTPEGLWDSCRSDGVEPPKRFRDVVNAQWRWEAYIAAWLDVREQYIEAVKPAPPPPHRDFEAGDARLKAAREAEIADWPAQDERNKAAGLYDNPFMVQRRNERILITYLEPDGPKIDRCPTVRLLPAAGRCANHVGRAMNPAHVDLTGRSADAALQALGLYSIQSNDWRRYYVNWAVPWELTEIVRPEGDAT